MWSDSAMRRIPVQNVSGKDYRLGIARRRRNRGCNIHLRGFEMTLKEDLTRFPENIFLFLMAACALMFVYLCYIMYW
jgi:hypothetical protein